MTRTRQVKRPCLIPTADTTRPLRNPSDFWPALGARWVLPCALGLVALVSVWMASERVELIALGPDPDGDAYGHHVIARELLKAPFNHGKHWVWLPLFHWLQLPLIAWGGNMTTVRLINVGLWTAMPVLLFGYLLRDVFGAWPWRPRMNATGTGKPLATWGDLLTATTAAILLALAPLGMQMGTTAQPEPLFAVLVLLFAWSADKGRLWPAGVCLTLAVLLRYEAWSVLMFTGAVVAFKVGRHYFKERTFAGMLGWLALAIVPGLAILGWSLLRLPHDSGRFMWFVRGTHDFAQEALLEKNSFQQGGMTLWLDLNRYVWIVPHRTFGFVAALGVLGLWRAWTRHFWLSLACLGVLAFITFGWLMRSTLGLERHFVSILPWYALLMALGVVHVIELGGKATAQLAGAGSKLVQSAALTLAAVGSLALIAGVGAAAVPWLRDWRHAIEHTFADQLEVARFIDTLPRNPPLFCDEPTVEGLSHVPYRDVQRGSIDWAPVREQIYTAANSNGGTYVVSWLGKLARLPRQGTVVFRPKSTRDAQIGAEGHPDKSAGLAVMRLEPEAVQTSSLAR